MRASAKEYMPVSEKMRSAIMKYNGRPSRPRMVHSSSGADLSAAAPGQVSMNSTVSMLKESLRSETI